MIDVKKLISGFLILAAAAVSSGFILSFIGNSLPVATVPAGPQITGIGSSNPYTPLDANAFVDTGSLQGNAAEMLSQINTTSTATAAGDPTNLTNAFAQSFLNGLAVANPAGIMTDNSGNPAFNAPDTNAVAATISASPIFQNFTPPNWDKEVQSQAIKSVAASSQNDIAQYNNSLNTVFEKYFVSTNLQNVVSGQNGDPTQVAYISSQLQGALGDLLNVKTPAQFVGFQKSLVRVMVYEKNSVAIAQNASADPVKTALIMQGEQSKYSAALNDLGVQMKKASAQGLSFGNISPTKTSFIAKLFGVQTAHAQWITFDPTAFGEMLLTYLQDTILQILKNVLVQLLQTKVLTWIQGSGAPRFVTDFGSQMVNSFQTAATNKLNSYMACVPSSQAPSLKILLSTPSVAQQNSACGTQFQNQLSTNNLQRLKNNFTNFNDYLSLFSSGGNGWSVLMRANDVTMAAGIQSSQAKQTQTVAQQGWKGSESCGQGNGDPNGYHYTCPDGGTLDGTKCDMGDFLIPEDAISVANNGSCNDGKAPQTTSPGQVTSQGFMSSLKSGVENITSAQNIAGILNALLSSLLNTLAQNAINYSTQALNGALNGGGGGSSDSGLSGATLTSSSTPQAGVQCLPSVAPVIISSSTGIGAANLSAGGGAINLTCAQNGNCPSTMNSDGTPHYSWSAPGSMQNTGSPISGSTLSVTYNATGTYFATVTASTDNSTATCEIDVTKN